MSLASVVKVELVKLSRKKTTRLLLLLFAPSVLFGVGMSLGLSFFVSDGAGGGVDAVGGAMAGLGFAVSMMEQSDFILFLVAIILASLSLSGELENGQIKSQIIRVCGRWKIVLAKYIALLSCILGTLLLSILWSILIYALLLRGTGFASGLLFDSMSPAQLGYILFTALGIATVTAFTFLLGTRMKSFPGFSISYILWFASLYTDFMGKVKYLIPYNMPGHILETADIPWPYALLYVGYVILLLTVSSVLFAKRDIQT